MDSDSIARKPDKMKEGTVAQAIRFRREFEQLGLAHAPAHKKVALLSCFNSENTSHPQVDSKASPHDCESFGGFHWGATQPTNTRVVCEAPHGIPTDTKPERCQRSGHENLQMFQQPVNMSLQ